MKYVPGPFVGQLSRSQGNTTAAHNRFGSYLRNRVVPVNPNTPPQQVQRNNLAELSAEYRERSDTERAGWEALGLQFTKLDSLGQVYNFTGAQAYVSVNRNRRLFGLADLDEAPLFSSASLLTTIELEADGTPTLSIAFTPTPLQADEGLILELTRQVSQGKSSLPRSEYKIVYIDAASQASPVDVLSAYEDIFGELVVGSRIFVRGRIVKDNAFTGVPLYASAVVGVGGG